MTITMSDVITIDKREDGSGQYGFYLVVLLFDNATGRLQTEERYFVARSMLCKYTRDVGDESAAWNGYPLADYASSRELLEMCLQRHSENSSLQVFISAPILVELTRTDIEAIDEAKQPYSRFDGARSFEHTFGKVEDSTTYADWA